ncbi:MAG: chalcone isomerase family protein [Rhodocyclales bacterium]|nr:chalcone isomerase family protein [Rhodocyclales bacterium]
MARFGMTTAVVLAALLFAVPLAQAVEVGGVRIDEQAKVGTTDLLLNGAGIRTRIFFKVYVGALYLPKKTNLAVAVIESKEPRRVVLHMLRDLSADQLFGALMDGLKNNHGEAELAKLKPDTDQFENLMRGIGNARTGDVIGIDFSADGIAVAFNGQARGNVASEAFGRALLKVWLGDKPADGDLKRAMLGG